MNKIILGISFIFSFITYAFSAEGQIVYETATSSAIVKVVALSTSTATRITPTKAQSLRGDGKYISWYSTTLYNVNTTSVTYAFGSSETVAPPEATCDLGAPVCAGTPTSPGWVTEQVQGMYLWAIACNTANSIKKVIRGR